MQTLEHSPGGQPPSRRGFLASLAMFLAAPSALRAAAFDADNMLPATLPARDGTLLDSLLAEALSRKAIGMFLKEVVDEPNTLSVEFETLSGLVSLPRRVPVGAVDRLFDDMRNRIEFMASAPFMRCGVLAGRLARGGEITAYVSFSLLQGSSDLRAHRRAHLTSYFPGTTRSMRPAPFAACVA